MDLITEKAPPGYDKVIEKIHEKDKAINKGMLIARYWNIFNEVVKSNRDEFKGLITWVKNIKGEKRVKVKEGCWDEVATIVKRINTENDE